MLFIGAPRLPLFLVSPDLIRNLVVKKSPFQRRLESSVFKLSSLSKAKDLLWAFNSQSAFRVVNSPGLQAWEQWIFFL
jgi:hypothetical protein